MSQQLRVVNNASQAVTNTSGSSGALVVPTGLIRVVATVDSYISLTASAATVDNTGIVIAAGAENLFLVANGSFVNGLRVGGTDGRISITCVSLGR
jgi:hypothetical protein